MVHSFSAGPLVQMCLMLTSASTSLRDWQLVFPRMLAPARSPVQNRVFQAQEAQDAAMRLAAEALEAKGQSRGSLTGVALATRNSQLASSHLAAFTACHQTRVSSCLPAKGSEKGWRPGSIHRLQLREPGPKLVALQLLAAK